MYGANLANNGHIYAHLGRAWGYYWIWLIFGYVIPIRYAHMVKVDFLAGKFFLATFGQICVFGHPQAKNWILGHFLELGLRKNT